MFNEEKKLSTTSVSTTEVFTTDFNVSEDEEEDQTDNCIESRMPSRVIEAVFDCDPYLSCPVASCNNIKLTTSKDDDDDFVFDCDPYLSCPVASCNNTKLTTSNDDDDGIFKMTCKTWNWKFRVSNCTSSSRDILLLKINNLLTPDANSGAERITVKDHRIERLQFVFERLRKHGLKLKTSKCHFFKTEVKYLGHVISLEGIRTDPNKTSAIKDWKIPNTEKN
ncbi:unnamed protein product [Mytilus coruscus]|uniref:Reverse transcriptase domain-containing protein n=1 Tax=Mytilus coruscus TaxID=42192 RepID=A0A6J8E0T3_MYTCO|nr:unnamed protein product [Mytilus coruscus]